MRFTPSNPGDSSPVVPGGTYLSTVVKSEETTSKAGNPMLKLKMHVLHPSTGETVTFYDFLVGSEAAVWKIKQFCDSAGLTDKYESGELTALDCEGKEVRVELTVEEDPQYGAQNRVKKYLGSTCA